MSSVSTKRSRRKETAGEPNRYLSGKLHNWGGGDNGLEGFEQSDLKLLGSTEDCSQWVSEHFIHYVQSNPCTRTSMSNWKTSWSVKWWRHGEKNGKVPGTNGEGGAFPGEYGSGHLCRNSSNCSVVYTSALGHHTTYNSCRKAET